MTQPREIPSDLWDILSGRLTDSRREKMQRVAANRTRHIRLIVQDVHQPHNVSACMRSAEAFGISDVHVVEIKNKFRPSTVARGVHGWLNIHRHDDIASCSRELREQGFLIAAGMAAQNSVSLGELPTDQPIALLFGNEHEGISPDWKPFVDTFFTIPMVGIVESLNISVSAAISMHSMTERARLALPADRYHLSVPEQNALLGKWLASQIKTWEAEYHHHKKSRP